ncbi:unnamed protein product [Alopecurus aequalis]
MDYVPALDVGICSVDALPINASPPSESDAPALDESRAFPFQMQPKRCRQPVAVRNRSWPVALPSALMAPAAHNGHGGDESGDDGQVVQPRNSSCGVLRGSAGRQEQNTCRHCHATETPQWRPGPDGPGTLCNGCGIRYRRAGDRYLAEHGHRRVPRAASFAGMSRRAAGISW